MTHIEAVGSVVGWPTDWVVIDPTNRLLCYSNIDEVEIVFFCIIFAFVIYDTFCFIVNHHFFFCTGYQFLNYDFHTSYIIILIQFFFIFMV